jgi:hypothetical protein
MWRETMAKFGVEVSRTIYLNLLLEAEAPEEAEKIAKEQIETGWQDLNNWKEYLSERGYHAELKG